MTHRSRSGGPQRQRGGQKKKHTRKLHHPPPPVQDSNPQEEDDTSLPASAYLDTPTDNEILELVHHALRFSLDSPEFSATVQKVKGLLYDKEWLEVFTNPTLLDSYAGRWVPSRGCCYRELFAHHGPIRRLFTVPAGAHGEEEGGDGSDQEEEEEEEEGDEDDEGVDRENEAGPSTPPKQQVRFSEPGDMPTTGTTTTITPTTTNILSLGGGASSELLAVAALIRASQALSPPPPQGKTDRKGKSPVKWNWTGIDIGAWDGVIDKFRSSLKEEWELEEDDSLNIDFIQGDLLGPSSSSPSSSDPKPAFPPVDLPKILVEKQPDLITILFTLTELLTQSRPKTISLLHSLTAHTPSGSLLLIADSASDISEFEMGSSGRKWPIYMILDMILLGPPSSSGSSGGVQWECLRKEDSRWFRLPPGVGAGWPVKLENTRYWYRLYRRV